MSTSSTPPSPAAPAAKQAPFISLWLDSYDDIFSDFDPRPFLQRNVSDDFLAEIKKVSAESKTRIEHIRLLLPAAKREAETEKVIAQRLHSFFLKNRNYFLKQKSVQRKRELAFILAGTLLMLCASFISSRQSGRLLMHLLLVIVEPAGWFLVWTGMDNLLNTERKTRPEIELNTRLSKSRIVFMNIAAGE